MLSEARARLANTQGKKAKRKAREKQLEEARRLASLQKRRELRAAGIEQKFQPRKRKRGVDYNEEIPFEKVAPRGFYDPLKDERVTPGAFQAKTRQDLEGGPTRDQKEAKERKKDKQRMEDLKKNDMTRAVMQLNKLHDDEGAGRKRSKLVMPAPQTTEGELEELVKMGQSAEAAIANVKAHGPSSALLQDYSITPQGIQLRTPRAPQQEDILFKEARNIIALNQTQSILSVGFCAGFLTHLLPNSLLLSNNCWLCMVSVRMRIIYIGLG